MLDLDRRAGGSGGSGGVGSPGGRSSAGTGSIGGSGGGTSADRGSSGFDSKSRTRILGTGGGSLPKKETGSLGPIRPRTLSPAPGVRKGVDSLGAASGTGRTGVLDSDRRGGSGAGGLDTRSGGRDLGVGDLGAGVASGAIAAGGLGRGAGVDSFNGKRDAALDGGRDYRRTNGGYRGESYGGDYYHGDYYHHYDPYYCGYNYRPGYGWWFGFGWDCWGWGWGWGYPRYGYGYYGPSSCWYFGIGFGWPYYYGYGSCWPYYYGSYYPFHRVYHYGYTSYCPERVVIYETYYDTVSSAEYVEPLEGGVEEPTLPEDPLVNGDVLLRAGKYEEAVAAYREAVESEPDNSVAKFALADALFAVGEYHEATYMVRRGLAQDPEWLDASVSKGDIFASNEEFERLLGVLEAHAMERPYDASSWYLLGFQQYYHGRLAESVSALERTVSVLPGDALTQRTLDKARERKAAAEARRARESAVAPAGDRGSSESVDSAAAPAGGSAEVDAASTEEAASKDGRRELK